MARLHVLGSYHGPGERKTAEWLANELPDTWDVIANRQIPDGMGTVDMDLLLVGPHAVFVVDHAERHRLQTGCHGTDRRGLGPREREEPGG